MHVSAKSPTGVPVMGFPLGAGAGSPSPTPAEAGVGDIRYSLVELGLPWLLVGETYSEATYPELADLFTVTSGEFDVPALVVPGYFVYIYSGVE